MTGQSLAGSSWHGHENRPPAMATTAVTLLKGRNCLRSANESTHGSRMRRELLFDPTRTEGKTIVEITVETDIMAPIEEVWRAYTTPEDIRQWNAASEDWHTTAAAV